MAGLHRIVQQHMLISSRLKLKPASACLKYECGFFFFFYKNCCAAKT